MDPVTAFSLAAGVLQVVELSLKALSTCKEFYNDDSLAQHRNTEALTKDLGWCSRAGFCLSRLIAESNTLHIS